MTQKGSEEIENQVRSVEQKLPATSILMLLTNAYDPDPRVRQEALALTKMGCRVRLLAWDRDHERPAHEDMEGVEVERIFVHSRHGRGTTQIFFYLLVFLHMLWRGLRTSFDVIHCHDLDTLPLGLILAKVKRKRIVYDAHEAFVEMLQGSVNQEVLHLLRYLQDFMIRRVDLLITVGERMRQYFADRGARRTAVVGNWKRLEEFAFSSEQNLQLRHRLGIPDDALMVIFIANLSKERKIEELLQAAQECPDVYVVIGGKGVLEPIVREWVAKEPRIKYLGFVPAWRIPAYTCAADVAYYGFDPSNGMAQYSAPHKLFEALAAGKPMITGDFGEIADVVREASCGIVLPAYTVAAISSALMTMRHKPSWDAFARNARNIGRRKNWAKGEEILRQEYSKLCPLEFNMFINVSTDPTSKQEPAGKILGGSVLG